MVSCIASILTSKKRSLKRGHQLLCQGSWCAQSVHIDRKAKISSTFAAQLGSSLLYICHIASAHVNAKVHTG